MLTIMRTLTVLTASLILAATGQCAENWQDGKVTEVSQERFGGTKNGGLVRFGGDKAIVYTIQSGNLTIVAGELSMAHHAFKPERFKVGDTIRFDLNERKGKVDIIDHDGKQRKLDVMKQSRS
jgi:hypothetical protein